MLQEGEGSLIVVRRPMNYKESSMYIPYNSGLGFFDKKDINKHVKICKFATSNNKQSVIAGKVMLIHIY